MDSKIWKQSRYENGQPDRKTVSQIGKWTARYEEDSQMTTDQQRQK
jgi:hypothetical protein